MYEDSIHKIVEKLSNTNSHLFSWDEDLEKYILAASCILQQLGFRTDLAYDKIKSNLIIKGLDSSTSISVIENFIEKITV